jgi:E3 ubiquitin-protein ligase SIAH1
MERRCPCCNESIGDFRCRATEKILAGMSRPCRFQKHGCWETVRYTEARLHEAEVCRYAPYRCPFDGCAYRGLELYAHIIDDHAAVATSGMGLLRRMTVTLNKCEPFRALLHRDGESVFLLLNEGHVLTGRSLSLISVCPYPEEVEEEDNFAETEYRMLVKAVDEPGSLELTASGTVQFVRRLEGYKAKGFLFVPDDFWGSSGSVSVTVHL